MRHIDKIILHCSATREGRPFKLADIERWHRERGFFDAASGVSCGYHYIVDLDGNVEAGRPETSVGAHCLGHNRDSIGICYIGGLDANGNSKDTRTGAQKKALRELLIELRKKYPKATIHGHFEFANKACPAFDPRKEYAGL